MSSNHNCCDKQNVRKGLWSPEEDEKLVNFIRENGISCWSTMPKYAGLERCGKSCRLRWVNYLRPDLKRGTFTPQEAALVIECHKLVGNRWSHIAHLLPGRTDNEIKNFWNSSLKKKIVAHLRYVQDRKKAAAAAAAAACFAQSRNLYYVNPDPMILEAAPVALVVPAPVQIYVPGPVEVQVSPVSDVPAAAWHAQDYYPEMMPRNYQNVLYEYDDDFISQFEDPTPFFDELERKEFGVPVSSAVEEQVFAQPANQGPVISLDMKVPPHHIDFIESRLAAFMASTPSPISSSKNQYLLMDPSPSGEAFCVDSCIATPSSPWDFSEF
ncbi:hypothetical protein F511_15619 [Dorcoceras hygrometricum]|uniref:Uncharacterized protein n=1 Tax=Dorcoceras hygrometricum TaxID=472368 RepID=A0A2Z7AJC3_9LAMI|nr:hypothetical protein F511_15619 [Dorcoceras hygrometricum]